MLQPYDENKSTCSNEISSTEKKPFTGSMKLAQMTRDQLDSGYDTDVSAPSQCLTPMFYAEEDDSACFDKFENVDLDNDVFETDILHVDTSYWKNVDLDKNVPKIDFLYICENLIGSKVVDNIVSENDEEPDTAFNADYETDSADNEVEEILRHEISVEKCLSNKSASNLSHRPSAPVPQLFHSEMVTKCTCWDNLTLSKYENNTTLVPCDIHHFRPVGKLLRDRNKMLDDEVSKSAFRRCGLDLKSYSHFLSRGAISFRRRTRSECLQLAGPLPDVVACTTYEQRPVSLPDILNLSRHNEETFGRELRRIADDFESVHADRRKKVPTVVWNVLNVSFTFQLSTCLGLIQQLLILCQWNNLPHR